MYKKFSMTFLLLVGSLTWGQSAPSSPSQKELLNELEAATPTAHPSPAKENKSATEQKPQTVRSPDLSLGTIAGGGLSTNVAPATVLSNDELLLRGKTIYVVSESFFVKKEQLERGLINRKELGDWGIHVVNLPLSADLVLHVRRAPFQNNFPFTFTDRVSGIVVMGGTVNSLFGTVPGKIAGRLAEKLKEIRTQSARSSGESGDRR